MGRQIIRESDGEVFDIEYGQIFTVGTSEEATIQIEGDGVAPTHAAFVWIPRQLHPILLNLGGECRLYGWKSGHSDVGCGAFEFLQEGDTISFGTEDTKQLRFTELR